MNYLIDTNILVRLAEPGDPSNELTLDAVGVLFRQSHKLYVIPQNLYELWVVCTRPTSANGLGKTSAETVAELSNIKSVFSWLDDTPDVFSVWERLVTTTPVLGKKAHDARLVAAMMVHGLTHILTLNARDFRNYPAIQPVTPSDVLTPRP